MSSRSSCSSRATEVLSELYPRKKASFLLQASLQSSSVAGPEGCSSRNNPRVESTVQDAINVEGERDTRQGSRYFAAAESTEGDDRLH
jgi:hypothetical protein